MLARTQRLFGCSVPLGLVYRPPHLSMDTVFFDTGELRATVPSQLFCGTDCHRQSTAPSEATLRLSYTASLLARLEPGG